MADRSVPADPAPSASLTPQPNQILAQPATVEACQADHAGHDLASEAAARDQLAFTRINAAGGGR